MIRVPLRSFMSQGNDCQDRPPQRLRQSAPCCDHLPQAGIQNDFSAYCVGFCVARFANRVFLRRIRRLFDSPWAD